MFFWLWTHALTTNERGKNGETTLYFVLLYKFAFYTPHIILYIPNSKPKNQIHAATNSLFHVGLSILDLY